MRELEGFSDYKITEEGSVYSSKSKRFLKQRLFPSGGKYLNVTLVLERKVYPKYIHRLVAETFIPNPENKP